MMSLDWQRRIVWLGLLAAIACTTPAPSDLASLERAAEGGDARAQSLLGSAYAEGRGVPIDHEAAIAWHKKAAHQGEIASQVALGRYYLSGESPRRKRCWVWCISAALGADS
jgi:TPR repeat protein